MRKTTPFPESIARCRMCKCGCPRESCPRLDQLQSLCLNRVEYGVTQEGAGVENLDSDHLVLIVQFHGNVWVEFYASGFRLVGDDQVKHILLLEVFDTWVIHG